MEACLIFRLIVDFPGNQGNSAGPRAKISGKVTAASTVVSVSAAAINSLSSLKRRRFVLTSVPAA